MKLISISEAETIAGKRLDRRRSYYTTDNGEPEGPDGCYPGERVFIWCEWTQSCSGCAETVDGQNVFNYPIDKKHGCMIGSGCHECGYTGKRRNGFFFPVSVLEIEKEIASEGRGI